MRKWLYRPTRYSKPAAQPSWRCGPHWVLAVCACGSRGRAVRATFALASASSPVSGLRHLAHALCAGSNHLSAQRQTGAKLRHQKLLAQVERECGDDPSGKLNPPRNHHPSVQQRRRIACCRAVHHSPLAFETLETAPSQVLGLSVVDSQMSCRCSFFLIGNQTDRTEDDLAKSILDDQSARIWMTVMLKGGPWVTVHCSLSLSAGSTLLSLSCADSWLSSLLGCVVGGKPVPASSRVGALQLWS